MNVHLFVFSAISTMLASASMEDQICGPRCVQVILSTYNKRVPLRDLVLEIQAGDMRAGAKFEDLAEVLEQHGVHVQFAVLPDGSQLNWKFPVIIHLPAQPPDSLGHFVVWLSSHGDACRIFDPFAGTLTGSAVELSTHMSKTVLLTSDRPITSDCVFATHMHTTPPVGLIVMLCLNCLILWRLIPRRKRSAQPSSPSKEIN